MNKLILLVVLALGTSAQAAKLIHSEAWTTAEKETKVRMGSGLGETGFGGPAAVCFIGNLDSVCKAVKADSEASIAQYNEGDHGKYELNKCDVVKSKYAWETVVKVNYTRVNDYDDDVIVDLEITNCN